MKYLHIVHTISGPAQSWAFTSEKRAIRFLDSLRQHGGNPITVLTTAPLNQPAASHLRGNVTLDRQGRVLVSTVPVPLPATSPEPQFKILDHPSLPGDGPWARCLLAASKGRKGAGEAAARVEQLVLGMRETGLWPTTDAEAKALTLHARTSFATPHWFRTAPVPQDTGQQPPALLSGLVICPQHHSIMTRHQSSHLCLTPIGFPEHHDPLSLRPASPRPELGGCEARGQLVYFDPDTDAGSRRLKELRAAHVR